MYTTTLAAGVPRSRLPVVLGIVASIPVFGLQVGTGGATTVDYLRMRGNKGYALIACNFDYDYAAATKASPADDLGLIRTVLRPSITDLAKALGVSRQAVYDWQAGRPIAAGNAARIEDMARAAQFFAREGLQATPHLMRRSIAQGKNFFEIIREGGSAETAARDLINIIRGELKQREALAARLARRGRPTREEFHDAGAPMLDEKS